MAIECCEQRMCDLFRQINAQKARIVGNNYNLFSEKWNDWVTP